MKFEEFVKKYGFDDVEEAKNKIKYYQEYFDCDFEGAIDMVKKQPKILGLSEEKVCAQVDFLKEAFSLEEWRVKKLVVKNSNYLGVTKKVIDAKKESIKTILKLSSEEANSLVCKFPEIISIKESALEERCKFFEKMLLISPKEAGILAFNAPEVLKSDAFDKIKENFKDNMKYLQQITDKNAIIKNALLLTFPAKKIKIRYLILAPICGKEIALSGNNLIKKEKLLWARREFLRIRGMDLALIYEPKSKFEKRATFSDSELMKKYPFTIENLETLEREYFEKFGEHLTLNSEEKHEVFACQEQLNSRKYNSVKKKQERESEI